MSKRKNGSVFPHTHPIYDLSNAHWSPCINANTASLVASMGGTVRERSNAQRHRQSHHMLQTWPELCTYWAEISHEAT